MFKPKTKQNYYFYFFSIGLTTTENTNRTVAIQPFTLKDVFKKRKKAKIGFITSLKQGI